MKKYTVTTTEKLRALCIENNWFTCGDNRQYEKLFYANENGCSIEEIATIIWLCSDDECYRRDILFELQEARIDFWKNMFGVEDANAKYVFYGYSGEPSTFTFELFIHLYFENAEYPEWENGYEDIVKITDTIGNTVWEREYE